MNGFQFGTKIVPNLCCRVISSGGLPARSKTVLMPYSEIANGSNLAIK